MIGLLFAAATATATPLLPPPWQPLPTHAVGEYARYTRHELDGSDSTLTAGRIVCNCQPDFYASLISKGLSSKYPSASVNRYVATVCGHSGQRLLATGVAAADPREDNEEMLFFRDGATVYVLTYTFRTDSPQTDAEQALNALCPS